MLKDKLQHIHVKMKNDETENSLLLYIFSALIDEKKNLSETGEDLQSAPNVSLRLRRIEQRLDVALFQGSL